MRFAVGFALLLAGCYDLDGAGTCTPCTATVDAWAAIDLTSEQLNHATATLCSDEYSCVSGTLEVNFGNPVAWLGGTGDVEVDVVANGTQVEIHFKRSGDVGLLGGTSGSMVSATIVDQTGATLLDVSGSGQITDVDTGCLGDCESASIEMM